MFNIVHPLYQEDLVNSVYDSIFHDSDRILITGATGLIGSLAVDAILSLNEREGKRIEIFALGRTIDKLRKRFSYWYEKNVYKFLHLIVGDVCNVDLTPYKFDYILHAASNADPQAYAVEPVETIITNVKGTCNILDYARKNENTRVLLTSTFEVNGFIEGTNTYSESMYGSIDCGRLRSGYPESKRIAELLFRSYGEEYGVDYVIARLSSVYGPTMSGGDSKAHAQFIQNALNGEDIVLKSEGSQKRTYTYAVDAVRGIFYLLTKREITGIYNVANGNVIASIAEVAKTVGEISGRQVIFDLPDSIEAKGFSSPQDNILDTAKIESIGWHGWYNLRSGLERTLSIMENGTV